jgi:hypothetical protein
MTAEERAKAVVREQCDYAREAMDLNHAGEWLPMLEANHLRYAIVQAIRAAVEEELTACAELCDDLLEDAEPDDEYDDGFVAGVNRAARAIRERARSGPRPASAEG